MLELPKQEVVRWKATQVAIDAVNHQRRSSFWKTRLLFPHTQSRAALVSFIHVPIPGYITDPPAQPGLLGRLLVGMLPR